VSCTTTFGDRLEGYAWLRLFLFLPFTHTHCLLASRRDSLRAHT